MAKLIRIFSGSGNSIVDGLEEFVLMEPERTYFRGKKNPLTFGTLDDLSIPSLAGPIAVHWSGVEIV